MSIDPTRTGYEHIALTYYLPDHILDRIRYTYLNGDIKIDDLKLFEIIKQWVEYDHIDLQFDMGRLSAWRLK